MDLQLTTKAGATGLQSTVRGLHVTPSAPLPYLNGVVVRSFVLEREAGNVIVYNSPGIDAAADEILALGQPIRLLVNHHHEAMYGATALDLPIYVHEADRRQTSLPIAGTFSARETLGDDLELIPTPGHTGGTTAFLWDNGGHRFLFPGDSVWVQGGEWKAVLLGDGNRAAYVESIGRMMDLDFDVLVPWGHEEDAPYGYRVDRAEGRENLARIRQRLENGQNA